MVMQAIKNAVGRIFGQTSGIINPQPWLVKWARGGIESDTGITLTGASIYSYAPYFCAVNRIAGQIGVMRMELKQKMPDGTIRIVDHKEQRRVRIVNLEPNPHLTAMDMQHSVQADAITWGNGRIAIEREPVYGEPIGLYYLPPSQTQTYIQLVDGIPDVYHVTTLVNGQQVWIHDTDCLHMKNLSLDGYVGLSLIALATNSIGGGLAGEQLTNRSYANDARPGLVLSAPEKSAYFNNDQRARQYLEDFNSAHAGTAQSGRVALLRMGVQATELSMSNRDAQILELRGFSREEVLYWTGLEHLPGIETESSYNSVEQRNAAEYRNCYAPWICRWEQQFNRKMLNRQLRDRGYFWQFDTMGLLRGSMKETMETLAIGRTNGFIGQQEGRTLLGLGPMDPDDDYSNPNTTPGDGEAAVEEPPEESEGTDQEPMENAVRRYLASEARGLITIAKREPKRFLEAADELYFQRMAKLTSLVADLGGSPDVARDWVASSRRDLATLASEVEHGQLEAGMRTLGQLWETMRIKTIVQQIQGNGNGRRTDD